MIRTSGNALHNNSVVVGRTQSGNVGLLRDLLHPAGSVIVNLGMAAQPGSVKRLSDGRIYGPIDYIRSLAAQLGTGTGIQPDARFYAPPGLMGGGRQPMDHEPGCAYLEVNGDVTPVNCFHSDANPPELMDAVDINTGDVIYPNRAVYRGTNPPNSRFVAQAPSTSSTPFNL